MATGRSQPEFHHRRTGWCLYRVQKAREFYVGIVAPDPAARTCPGDVGRGLVPRLVAAGGPPISQSLKGHEALMSAPSLILASASQRRKEILEAMGIAFVIRVADVDESLLTDESPADMVLRLASAKAAANPAGHGEIVIGADTAVVLGAECFGKPADFEDALRMLSALSGQTHQVMTGVAVANATSVATALSVTEVRFRDIGADEVRRYWQSGEPQGKAGAYAIQGRGGMFVEAIMGSYTGVVGLPVFETARLLQAEGLDVLPAELTESQSDA